MNKVWRVKEEEQAEYLEMFRDHFAEHFADLGLNDDDGGAEDMEVDRSTMGPSGSRVSHVLGMKLLEGELLDDLVRLHARLDTPSLPSCFFFSPLSTLLSQITAVGFLRHRGWSRDLVSLPLPTQAGMFANDPLDGLFAR